MHGSFNSANNEIATANYKIYGTNPGKYLIDSEIKDPIQASIACVESEYRQFDAPRENGQGLPLIGIDERGQKVGELSELCKLLIKNIPLQHFGLLAL